jgi:hypothetical protein
MHQKAERFLKSKLLVSPESNIKVRTHVAQERQIER